MQKCGTSALASYLSAHPALVLPVRKEAHVFDAPDFDDRMDVAAVDARFGGHFELCTDGRLHGDATPIYVLHPCFIERIHRYNPRMRWILLLRHPLERVVSNYHMERGRGCEKLPLWLALWREKGRLRGHMGDFSLKSPLRLHSYCLRSDYARQLDNLYMHFPREQVLVLRNEDLASHPEAVFKQVCEFLGVGLPPVLPEFAPVFVGDYKGLRRGSLRWRMLRWWMRRELCHQRERYGLEWLP
jgi:hypothetical protein